jgi:hypothetical protein
MGDLPEPKYMSAVTDSRVSAMLSDTNQIRCVIDTFVQHYVIKFVSQDFFLFS